MLTREKAEAINKHLKDNLDLKNVISHYTGVEIGNKNISCLFHEDKKPSMSVDNKLYYCHSCGAGGDVINFVMRYFDLKFYGAIIKLDNDFGFNMSNEKIKVSQQHKNKKSKLQQLKEEAEARKKKKADDDYFGEYRIYHNLLVSGALEPFSEEWIYCTNKITELEQYIN